MKQFLEAGKIVGTHGIKGEVRVDPWCDSPDFLTEFDCLYLNEGESNIEISSSRVHGNIVLIKINGVDSITSAEEYRGKILYINRKDIELSKGDYFIEDLIGCKVFDAETTDELGVISDVTRTGANDVWTVKAEEKEYLIPAIPEVVILVDIQNEKVIIKPMKGIFDDAN